MALIPGWLADLLGVRAAVDSANVEYPQRRLFRFLGCATVSDNDSLGTTDIDVGSSAFVWHAKQAPGAAINVFPPINPTLPDPFSEILGQFIVTRAFTATYLAFMCCNAALATDTVFVILRKNGVDTDIYFTIPAGTAPGTVVSDASHSASFSQGDKISIRLHQSGASAQADWYGVFMVG